MVTRLFPLNVKVSFEDRPYKLGETINLTVELSPKRDMEIREGRVDLVCEERWTEIYTIMVSGGRSVRMGGTINTPPKIPKQVSKKHMKAYVHSSFVFLQDTRLDSTTRGSYRVSLETEPESPPHPAEATVKWTLVAAIDVARARDIKTRRAVKISIN